MDIHSFLASLGEKKESLMKKALQCHSAEEMLTLARENGVALDEKGAAELFTSMGASSGSLSDDELDAVAGGADKANNVMCNSCGSQFYLPFGLYPAPPLHLTPSCRQCGSTNLSLIK
jgi:hypothetical protein